MVETARSHQPSLVEVTPSAQIGRYELVLGDSIEWLKVAAPNSLHGVITDPPYGLKEYDQDQLEKRRSGKGGVWRIPPALNGYTRKPVPRFTVLKSRDHRRLENFFSTVAQELLRVLVPGAHVFIATNPLVSYFTYGPFSDAGFEKRGEVIRLVTTLRGGDRPKNAHEEFPDVTVMPRSGWEPWGIFRKPLEGRVQDNLRKWKTGGLRRLSRSEPFKDVIPSSATPEAERTIAPLVSETSEIPQTIDEGGVTSRSGRDTRPIHGVRFHTSRGERLRA